MFKLTLANFKKADKNVSRWPRSLARALGDSIKEAAYIVESEAKQKLTAGPTRAILTGRLREDTKVRTIMPLKAEIGPLVHYAVYVHEGTKGMKPRPFLKVALKSAAPRIAKTFQKNIKTKLRLIK